MDAQKRRVRNGTERQNLFFFRPPIDIRPAASFSQISRYKLYQSKIYFNRVRMMRRPRIAFCQTSVRVNVSMWKTIPISRTMHARQSVLHLQLDGKPHRG